MPQLVRTPEDVLRATKQDLCYIQFTDEDAFDLPKDTIPGRKELLAWFERELPHVELEDLGPLEEGECIFLEGAPLGVFVRVAFDEASLAKYVETWENEDGSSKDPRWQCFIYTYQYYLEHKHDEYVKRPRYD